MSSTHPAPARALVTGSSSGIGEAIARRLLRDGWDVVGYDRAPATLEAPRFRAVTVDLADAPALSKAVAAERDVKAIVHAAGFADKRRFADLTRAGLERAFAVMAAAFHELAATALPVGMPRSSLSRTLAAGRVRTASSTAAVPTVR